MRLRRLLDLRGMVNKCESDGSADVVTLVPYDMPLREGVVVKYFYIWLKRRLPCALRNGICGRAVGNNAPLLS